MSGQAFRPPIGFMQGRLSPVIAGRIQAFPWPYWRDEFRLAERCRFPLMEWTLDAERLEENPLMTAAGRAEISRLSEETVVAVSSVTMDWVMQAPFYKVEAAERRRRLNTLERVLEACAEAGIRVLVVPLVDGGRLEDQGQEEALARGFQLFAALLAEAGLRVLFESDYPPQRLRRFIEQFPAWAFGINYDTGNSASLGYAAAEEIEAYGGRIGNVHVKDRIRGGGTVPLGAGDADFLRVFALLRNAGYAGPLILQTARAEDGDDAGELGRYRDLVETWLENLDDGA